MTNDLDRALIALRGSRDHGHGAVLNDAEVPALLAEIDRLTRERDEARAEITKLRGWYESAEQQIKTEQRLSFRAERDALRAALTELYEAEGAAFPAAPIGREAQDAWCERRVKAREQARAVLAQIEQERSDG